MTRHTGHSLLECLQAEVVRQRTILKIHDACPTYSEDEVARYPVTITDEEDDSKIVGRCATASVAENVIAHWPDQAKVARGGLGIDAPEGCPCSSAVYPHLCLHRNGKER